jgi:hypothetical protein
MKWITAIVLLIICELALVYAIYKLDKNRKKLEKRLSTKAKGRSHGA